MTETPFPTAGDLVPHGRTRPSLCRTLRTATYGAVLTAAAGAALTGLALTWGSIERRFPVLRRYEIQLPAHRNLPDFTLLHISDLHMYPGQEFLVDFLHQVAANEQIDAVISTGDNLGAVEGLPLAQAAHAPFLDLPGAFVLGSNDYFSPTRKRWSRYLSQDAREDDGHTEPDLPWAELARTFRSAGWEDLSNRSAVLDVRVGQPGSAPQRHVQLALIGVDDPHLDRDRLGNPVAQWDDDSVVRIGVTHAPYVRVLNGMADLGADIILAGHTHGGQLGLPGIGTLVTNCDLPRQWGKGLHEWTSRNAHCLLHVSAGLGTSPFVPFRIATRPEASLLHFRSSN